MIRSLIKKPVKKLRLCIPTATLALTLVLIASSAGAEPHFTVRTGLRCGHCHTSPLGGGKRTPYGALYAASSLAMTHAAPQTRWPVERQEDGSWVVTSLATGEVSDWMAVGADLRLSNNTTFADKTANSFEATQGTLYLELRPWPERVVLYLDEEIAAGGARNREAWAMIKGPWSTYLRGGRILPPFGLRLLDDAAYTRRATGVNFANPDLGLEVGLEVGPFFAALSLTNGTFGDVDTDALKAVSGTLELLLERLRVGISAAYNPTDEGCRTMLGLLSAVGLGRITLQGEAILLIDQLPGAEFRSYQLAAMAEADLLLTKGVGLHLGWDYHDPNLKLGGFRRQRFRFGLDLFAWPMVETKLYYIHKQSETGNPLDEDDRLEVMLHVYL